MNTLERLPQLRGALVTVWCCARQRDAAATVVEIGGKIRFFCRRGTGCNEFYGERQGAQGRRTRAFEGMAAALRKAGWTDEAIARVTAAEHGA